MPWSETGGRRRRRRLQFLRRSTRTCGLWTVVVPDNVSEDLKKGVKWQKQANDSFQSIIDRLTCLEEHDSWRQKEFDELQEKVYLLESQVGER